MENVMESHGPCTVNVYRICTDSTLTVQGPSLSMTFFMNKFLIRNAGSVLLV